MQYTVVKFMLFATIFASIASAMVELLLLRCTLRSAFHTPQRLDDDPFRSPCSTADREMVGLIKCSKLVSRGTILK